MIFTAKTPTPGDFFCRPKFNNTLVNVSAWIKAAHPYKYDYIEQEDSYNFCKVFNNSKIRYWNETNERGNQLSKCTDFKQIPSYRSLILEFELYCARDVLVPMTQSFHLLGVLIGGLIAAQLLKM